MDSPLGGGRCQDEKKEVCRPAKFGGKSSTKAISDRAL